MQLEATVQIGDAKVHLIGTIAGFVPDAERVRLALENGPERICLGIPPEDLEALSALHDQPDRAEELPELDEWTQRLFEHLAPFGETRIPSPELEIAFAHAARHDIPLTALDLDDATHTEAHTHSLKLRHIVRMNTARNRMLKKPFEAETAHELAVAWDAAEHSVKPLQAIQGLREKHMANQLRTHSHGDTVAIVPIARLAGVLAQLEVSE